jgi:glycosyltransferase involved in cell wall biosynthesis
MRHLYRKTDRIILPSKGAVEDFLTVTGVPDDLVRAVPSPVLTPELLVKASRKPEHPWFLDKRVPVLIGIGELSGRKDYATLVRAFSIMRKNRPARLVILGEGRQRPFLESLVQELGISSDVQLPGFANNPYSALANADLYVHSSRFEGSPVALMEAVSLGIPSVSTDCPSGPREILQDGKFGYLVSVGDAEAMARAMSLTLDRPPEREFVKKASAPFTLENSTNAYLRELGFA